VNYRRSIIRPLTNKSNNASSMNRTLPSSKIPHVKDCIAYMESLGWIFQYRNDPWYVFNNPNRTIWAGNHELTPTIKELREMYKNGF